MIIDFEMERQRRFQADDAAWCRIHDQLVELITASSALCDITIITATLCALLDCLESSHGMSRPDAKQYIAQILEECE